jgi:hypothetical protein
VQKAGLILIAFVAIRRTLFFEAESRLQTAGILPKCHYHKDGAKIVRELLKKGPISKNTYYCLVGADTGDKLLEARVFATRVNSQEITFKSTLMKRFCEENSARWEGKLGL